MAREKEGFRDQLERLSSKFPGVEAIGMNEAAELIGVQKRTLLNDKTFPAKKLGKSKTSKYIVPLVSLARWLA